VAPAPGAHRARSWRDALRSLGLEATLDGDSGVIMNLEGTGFLPTAPNRECSYGFRPAARVFPTDRDGTLTEFGELAERASGVKRLAALRMDVDDMGRLFREGLAEPTLSRVAALSSALGWFYEGYLNEICGEWPDKVYGLYSGGDDLFFVGSWDVMPRLAQKVHDEFAKYCAGNPHLTVSAGISLFPDKYPVYQAARDSDRALAASKAFGGGRKDAVTFLRRTVGWSDWPVVAEAHATLVQLISEGGPAAILQRLRMLHAMCEGDAHQRQPSKRWCWIAAYMLSQLARQYKDQQQTIAHIRDQLTDEAALDRWALAARWVQLEKRERAEDQGDTFRLA
jgi:CRISPR-associated protein Csm1